MGARSRLQGSGKTLAFGLPIMQLLLQEREREAAEAAAAAAEAGAEEQQPEGQQPQAQGQAQRKREGGKLQALVLAPTRELAMQVGGGWWVVGDG